MSTCQCSMAISMLGDGCRYCQPQTYIEHLLETLEDARATPVSEAKAQGVVMPELELQSAADEAFRAWEKAGDRIPHAMAYMAARDGFREGAAWQARLNAATVMPEHPFCEYCGGNDEEPQDHCMYCTRPVQQVSVPDVLREAIKWADHLCFECGALVQTRAPSVHVYNKTFEAVQAAKAMIDAAPAAPAADAGIVDMYRHLQKVTPYRFKKIQDASITDGGDVMYFHKDRFDAALLADMAAHCAAKGVV